MFAVLGALTPSLAGTILNKEFLTALKKQQKREKLKLKMTDRIEQNLTYDAIRLNNIGFFVTLLQCKRNHLSQLCSSGIGK
jgi:hypothetical protein